MEVHDRVTQLNPHLRRCARVLGTSEISSDELVRAPLERAQEQLDRYSREADLRIWLFSQMHHSYIAQLRGAEAAAELERSDFERAIASLPPAHREIVLPAPPEALSYQDVARAP